MDCEVCGKLIRSKPFKVVIEGVKLLVCPKCSLYSSSSRGFEVRSSDASRTPVRIPLSQRRRPKPLFSEELEFVKNYSQLIRSAREKLDLSHEELGRKIGEKVSVLQKIETKKIVPDYNLTRKLEHILRVKILRPYKPPQVTKEMLTQKPYKPTLGDVIVLQKKKSVGADTERGR